jgi:peptidoglycan-associated lipoprotein
MPAHALTGRSRILYALLLLPVLMGAKDRKGCCKPKDVDTDTTVTDGPDVEKAIQVVSIDPSAVGQNQGFEATIFGAGFASGASVTVGGSAATDVKVADENTISASVPAMAAGSYDVTVTNPDGASATLRRGLSVRGASIDECRHLTLQFDFDSSNLTADSRGLLDSKMGCFQGSPGTIAIEGHADERGTTEYNIALGDRRAEAVKRYLTQQGIAPSRIRTTSYGEEKPVSSGHDEASWARNRRAELDVTE